MKITIPKRSDINHNVSSESDISLILRYVGFFVFLILGLYIFFWLLSYIIIQFISIEQEQKIFGSLDIESELGEVQALPNILQERYQDIEYNVQLLDMGSEANAFAGLGGNIYITTGFVEQVDHLEELDFVIGHEIAHVEHRDVLRSLLTSLPVVLVLSIFGGDYGFMLYENIVGNPHSKLQETDADKYALDFLYNRNGHVGCALDFFEKGNTLETNILEIFSTHPMTHTRIERIKNYIDSQGYEQNECTPFIS